MNTIVLKSLVTALLISFNLSAATTVPLVAGFRIDAIHGDEYLCSIILTNMNQEAIVGWTAEFDCFDTQQQIVLVCPAQFTKTNCHVIMQNNDMFSSKVIDANKSLRLILIIKDPTHRQIQITNLSATGNLQSDTPVPAPTTPTLNTITATNGNYTVSWNSVTNATRYILQQSSTAAFGTPVTVFDGSATSKAFSNQAAGTYYYRVAAANDAGMSSFSAVKSVTVTTTPVPTPPATPTLKTITATNGNYIVSWNSVTGATRYILQQSLTAAFGSPTVVFDGSGTSKQFTNQSPGTYYYRVAAANSAGTSAYSGIKSVTIAVTPPTPLAAPTLSATASACTLQWNTVSGATNYILQESTDNFVTTNELQRGSNTSYSLANHATGIFNYRVKAINATADGTWSNTISIEIAQV